MYFNSYPLKRIFALKLTNSVLTKHWRLCTLLTSASLEMESSMMSHCKDPVWVFTNRLSKKLKKTLCFILQKRGRIFGVLLIFSPIRFTLSLFVSCKKALPVFHIFENWLKKLIAHKILRNQDFFIFLFSFSTKTPKIHYLIV